jgi:hypothetical protein
LALPSGLPGRGLAARAGVPGSGRTLPAQPGRRISAVADRTPAKTRREDFKLADFPLKATDLPGFFAATPAARGSYHLNP